MRSRSTAISTLLLLSVLAPALPAAAGGAPSGNIAVATSAATVSVLSPTAGTTVSGHVSVSVSGSVFGSQSDSAQWMYLYVDGSRYDYADCQSELSPYTCSSTFDWDSSGLSGQHTLQVKMDTYNGLSAVSAPITVTVVSAAPTATVLAPRSGATVSGTVPVSATGVVHQSQTDSPQWMYLYVDGSRYDYADCQSELDPHTCVATFDWDSSGLAGQHTLQIKLDTYNGRSAVSPPTTVTVVSPPPTATVLSPQAGATVSRGVPVRVSGSVHPSQTDSPQWMYLYVDGSRYDYADCQSELDPHTCLATFDWDSSGLSGQHTLQVKLDTYNGRSAVSAPVRVHVGGRATAPRNDYNGDGTADFAVFRPSNGTWYVRGITTTRNGASGDKPVPGDYDGDRKTDLAVFRPSNGTWYVRGITTTSYGGSGDTPVPGDYDGDGKTDIAVWRPSTGTWYVKGISTTSYGAEGDKPVPADYNGDGKTDIAVFRPSEGRWYVRGITSTAWGMSGDVPVVGDYNGDRRSDVAVWRPSTGTWYVRGLSTTQYGKLGDRPVPRDGNGDGRTDLVVWRPANGTWYLRGLSAVTYGRSGDLPL